MLSVFWHKTQKKRLKAQHNVHDIFLFLSDAVRVVVCNILSLLHWKGRRRNMIDLSMFSLWLSSVFYLTETVDLCLIDDWSRCQPAVHSACNHIQVYSCTVGCAHVVSSSFEVSCRDGWLDRARGLCARERNARALQSTACSLLGPNATQLIPGCFPFSAGGASPPLWNTFPTLHLFVSFSLPLIHAYWSKHIPTRPHSRSYSSSHPSVRLFRMHCTVDSISPVPPVLCQQPFLEVAICADYRNEKDFRMAYKLIWARETIIKHAQN